MSTTSDRSDRFTWQAGDVIFVPRDECSEWESERRGYTPDDDVTLVPLTDDEIEAIEAIVNAEFGQTDDESNQAPAEVEGAEFGF